MNSERSTWQVALLVVGVLAVAAIWGVVLATGAEPEVPEQSAQPVNLDTGDDAETVVVALGDSFTGGSDMNQGPVWFDQVADDEGWVAFNESVGGSGYTVAGQGQSFPARAGVVSSYTADLVIIAGGYNDGLASPDDVDAAARRTVSRVQAASPSSDVLLLSPFASGDPPAELETLAATLRQVARAEGVAYLDVTGLLAGHDDLIGSDGVHPTDAGHALLTEKIEAMLRAHSLPRADAYSG